MFALRNESEKITSQERGSLPNQKQVGRKCMYKIVISYSRTLNPAKYQPEADAEGYYDQFNDAEEKKLLKLKRMVPNNYNDLIRGD